MVDAGALRDFMANPTCLSASVANAIGTPWGSSHR
jgi:hypothetical protein